MSTQITSFPLGGVNFQGGYGIPNHISTRGSLYVDLNTAIQYINKDGLVNWVEFSTGSEINGEFLPLSGGTVTGSTIFSNGLIANSFSGTTIQSITINSGATINGLGYTPENVTNKTTNFSIINHVLYPSVQAVDEKKLDKIVQLSGETLNMTGWTLNAGLYEYNYVNTGITSTSIVDVIPHNASIEIIKLAEVYPQIISSTGSAIFYSKNSPTSAITVTINIIKN